MKTTTPTIRAPKGFRFRIDKSDSPYNAAEIIVYYILTIKGKKVEREIGRVSLEPSYRNNKTLHTHSHLSKVFHGMGLGSLMYARAIRWALENGYKIRSSGGTSDAAVRVWEGKTLRKYFDITKTRGGRYPIWAASSKSKSKAKKKSR